MEIVYPSLREIARDRLFRSPGITLSATDLANEAYVRLSKPLAQTWQDRGHFYAVAARSIRNIVVDHLRARGSEKRGGELPFVSLSDIDESNEPGQIDLDVDWLSVSEALDELEAVDAVCAQVVELKFFSGLTTDEIAAATSISRASVVRNWRFARAWLSGRLSAA